MPIHTRKFGQPTDQEVPVNKGVALADSLVGPVDFRGVRLGNRLRRGWQFLIPIPMVKFQPMKSKTQRLRFLSSIAIVTGG